MILLGKLYVSFYMKEERTILCIDHICNLWCVTGRHGSLANGAPQESKVGLLQGHISINLLCHQSWVLEETALTASLQPWDFLKMLKAWDIVRYVLLLLLHSYKNTCFALKDYLFFEGTLPDWIFLGIW